MSRQVHHNSNDHNIDKNVRALARAPRRVSLNADNARWREIEHGRMTFIMRVGRSTPSFSSFILRCPLSIAAIIFFPPSHTFSITRISFCGLHCISTCLDRIVPFPCLVTHLPHSQPPSRWGMLVLVAAVLLCRVASNFLVDRLIVVSLCLMVLITSTSG